MKKKIIEIATELSKGKITTKEAKGELLFLFGVVWRSEQLPCERCKKLEFMIENGLGWKDMENDCT